MIRNFRDHAANERTFLAWVRTAITIMAFGFVVERFDVFLRIARPSPAAHTGRFLSTKLGGAVGLALMAAGLAIVLVATLRFLSTRKEIDEAATRPEAGSRLDLALAAMLFLLGCALAVYLAANIVSG